MTHIELRTRLERAIEIIRLNMARRSPQYQQGANDAIKVIEKEFAAVVRDSDDD